MNFIEAMAGNNYKRTGYRGFVKSLLNRNTVYSLADYARKATKYTGQAYTMANVRSALKRMAAGHQISYSLVQGDNGAEYVAGCVWA